MDFNILRNDWPELAEFGTQAVNYTNSDPQTAAFKLRCFAEALTGEMYKHFQLPHNSKASFFELLAYEPFKKSLSSDVSSKLHLLRLHGNKAAHARDVSSDDVSMLVQEAYALATWLKNTFSTKQVADIKDHSQEAMISINKTNLLEFCSDIELTKDQTALIERLNSFFGNKSQNVFLLKGYAGTGKTYIIKVLTEFLNFSKRNYAVSAPTGKAARVISRKTNAISGTIHSLIYQIDKLQEYKEQEDASSKTYKFYANLRINNYPSNTVFIVDESSMISNNYQDDEFILFGSGLLLNDLFRFINIDHNDHEKKIILIGDNAQLPPVKMSFSPALNADYLGETYNIKNIEEYELREIVRQDFDSGIVRNSLFLRDSLSKDTFNKLDIDLSWPDVVHLEYEHLIANYLAARSQSIDDTILIVHTNEDVAGYNKRIREELFPGCEEIISGDKLLILQNCFINGVFFSNGDMVTAVDVDGNVERRTRTIKIKKNDIVQTVAVDLVFRDVMIEYDGQNGESLRTQVKIYENLLYDSNRGLSSDENRALYVDFCMRFPDLRPHTKEFKDELTRDPYFNALRVKFGYAITCHKAQGSEWKTVFLKCRATFMKTLSKDYFRWLYTAITRASRKLYLLEEPHIRIIGDRPAPPKLEPNIDNSLIPVKKESKFVESGVPINTVLAEALFNEIEKVTLSNTVLTEIKHHQNQEVYVFNNGSNTAHISFYYNKDNTVTKIHSKEVNEFASLLLEAFKPITNKSLITINDRGFTFPEEFLEELYLYIKEKTEIYDIVITGIKHIQYAERYYFEKNSATAVLDFHYNIQKQITGHSSLISLSTSQELLKEIIGVLGV